MREAYSLATVPTTVLFVVYTVLSVAGLALVKYWVPLFRLSLQAGTIVGKPAAMLFLGATTYVAGFLSWLIILDRAPLVTAYPTAVGLTMAFSTLIAIVLFGEKLSYLNFFGILFVFFGITMLSIGTR